METSERERWQNRKMEITAAKIFFVRLWNFAKNKKFWRADCSGPKWRHR